MKKSCHALVAAFVLISTAARAEVVQVYIIAGQSNAVGHASVKDLEPPLDKPQPSVSIYSHNLYQPQAQPWQALQPGLGAGKGEKFGPELSFGLVMAKEMPGQKIAIIKAAAGATNLSGQWRAGGEGKKQGDFYKKFIESVSAALKSPYPEDTLELAGMMWMQGEGDSTDRKAAEAYEENLANFLTQVRKDLEAPEMPVVVGLISEAKKWTFAEIVREGQMNVAKKLPNVATVETNDLTFNADGIHYDAAGLVTLGERFAKESLALRRR
jgi:hypothetical protein